MTTVIFGIPKPENATFTRDLVVKADDDFHSLFIKLMERCEDFDNTDSGIKDVIVWQLVKTCIEMLLATTFTKAAAMDEKWNNKHDFLILETTKSITDLMLKVRKELKESNYETFSEKPSVN